MHEVGYDRASDDPDGWTFVAGRAFLVAMPRDAPESVVAAVAALDAEPRVAAEVLVGLLPLGGPTALDAFAVVISGAGESVTVVLRGPIAVDVFSVGGSRRFTDDGIRPWNLADFPAVTHIVVGSPRDPVGWRDRTTDDHPGAGAIAARSAHWTLVESSGDALDPADIDDTVISFRRAPSDDTVITGDTVIRTEFRDPSADAHVPTGDPRPAGPPVPRYGFRLPDGREFRLDVPHLLGRHPRLPRIGTEPPPELVAVESPTALVSATHLDIRQAGDAVVVTDAGSRNGTIVTQPDGRRERLRPGDSRSVLPGTTIDIGDGNIIEILPGSGIEPASFFPVHRGRQHP